MELFILKTSLQIGVVITPIFMLNYSLWQEQKKIILGIHF